MLSAITNINELMQHFKIKFGQEINEILVLCGAKQSLPSISKGSLFHHKILINDFDKKDKSNLDRRQTSVYIKAVKTFIDNLETCFQHVKLFDIAFLKFMFSMDIHRKICCK